MISGLKDLAYRTPILALVAVFSGCGGNPSPSAPTPATTDNQPIASAPTNQLTISNPLMLHQMLDQRVADGGLPFIYVRLEDHNGRVLYERSAINRELLPNADIDGQTWIRIWSMSKIVTISVFMDLVEDGLVSLDDAVTTYIPEFASLQVATAADGSELGYFEDTPPPCPLQTGPVKTPMTVRNLLNHTAGFYYAITGIPCLDAPIAQANLPTAEDTDDLLARLANLPLMQQPGSKYYYGTNTTVLGIVAERATGKSLAELIEERITGPLQIKGLRYGLPEDAELLPRFSGADGSLRRANAGELDIFGPDVPDYDRNHELYLGGEGMLATADGYADFLRMLLQRGVLNGQRLLDDATISEMTAPHTLTDSPAGHNGYNIWVTSGTNRDGTPSRAGLWLGGGYEGTSFWIDPEYGFVAVVMTQVYDAPSAGQGIRNAVREAVYGQLERRP